MTDKPKREPIKTYMVLLTSDELWAVRIAVSQWKEDYFIKKNYATSEPQDEYDFNFYCDVSSGLRKLSTNWVLTNEHYNEQAKLQE